jgi:glutaredoxin-related protein
MTNAKLTLASPEVIKAVGVACGAEDAANDKWVSAASKLYMADVRHADLQDAKSEKYIAIRSMVVQAQKPNIVTLLTASSTVGFTDQERADRRYYGNRVDNVHMKRVREHLKRFEEAERGATERKTMGEVYAKKCQDMIEGINRAKEDKVDFDAVDAVKALKALKALFLA